ncbi:MAG TPA: DUF4388 domain-containing protein [Ktedonobacteraceae bacterium]|nr:DUF4388 domain-containing protein [Ktedonobacteraceae bacterium]
MEPTPSPYLPVSRPGYLAEVTLALLHIRDLSASGRLSIRNGERFGIAHLYFKEACLVHINGDKGDGEAILNDLLTWSKGAVRFDAALTVSYESITWQQAQIFTRWLAFLEMRGLMYGIPQMRLDRFVRDLTEHLPGEPIAFPLQIANYEDALAHQRLSLGDDLQRFIERAVPEEQRQHLQQVTKRVGDISFDLAKRAVSATWQGLRQIGEATSEAAKQSIIYADEMMRHTFDKDRHQQIIQSTQKSVESVKQITAQRVDTTLVQQLSAETPAVRVKSIRPVVSATDKSPVGR